MAYPPTNLTPPFRTPFTDIGGALLTHQWYGRCAELEMTTIDCLDAYGFYKGKEKCKDLLSDLKECFTQERQFKRIEAMQAERQRQIAAGERSPEDAYAPPPVRISY